MDLLILCATMMTFDDTEPAFRSLCICLTNFLYTRYKRACFESMKNMKTKSIKKQKSILNPFAYFTRRDGMYAV